MIKKRKLEMSKFLLLKLKLIFFIVFFISLKLKQRKISNKKLLFYLCILLKKQKW